MSRELTVDTLASCEYQSGMRTKGQRVVRPYEEILREDGKKCRECAAFPSPCSDARPSSSGLELIGPVEQLALILSGVFGPGYVPQSSGR